MSRRRRCPRCDRRLVPVVYGFPGPEVFKAAEEGRIVLGGCVIGLPGQKSQACPNDQCRQEALDQPPVLPEGSDPPAL